MQIVMWPRNGGPVLYTCNDIGSLHWGYCWCEVGQSTADYEVVASGSVSPSLRPWSSAGKWWIAPFGLGVSCCTK